MNVNPSSEQFCTVKPWDSLTDEEKASGDWIQLPDTTNARRKTEMEKVFGNPKSAPDDSLRKLFVGR